MARFKLNDEAEQSLNKVIDTTQEQEQKRNMNPNSLNNLNHGRPAVENPKPKAFMQLNIYEYDDYIYRMAKIQNEYVERVKEDGTVIRKRKNVSMTDYVLSLIKADFDKNEALYKELLERKDLDRPVRIPKNKPKK